MEEEREVTITIQDILKVFAKRWILILLTSLIFAAALFSYDYCFKKQYYKSSGMMYVNSSNLDLGSLSSITSGQITASRSLVSSYKVIMTSRTMVEKIIEEAELDEKYTYENVKEMISVDQVNSTEIFSVSITCVDQNDAYLLCTAIMNIFPKDVREIIDGSSVSIVDMPITAKPVSKSYSKYTLIGFLIGFVLSCGIFFVYDLFIDDTITSSDWLQQTFKDSIPLLSVVPDTTVENKKGYYKNYYKKNDEQETEWEELK